MSGILVSDWVELGQGCQRSEKAPGFASNLIMPFISSWASEFLLAQWVKNLAAAARTAAEVQLPFLAQELPCAEGEAIKKEEEKKSHLPEDSLEKASVTVTDVKTQVHCFLPSSKPPSPHNTCPPARAMPSTPGATQRLSVLSCSSGSMLQEEHAPVSCGHIALAPS